MFIVYDWIHERIVAGMGEKKGVIPVGFRQKFQLSPDMYNS